jgi:hypothetical protein
MAAGYGLNLKIAAIPLYSRLKRVEDEKYNINYR